MASDERRRHALFQRLEQVLGPDEASTLMEQLPPVPWTDIATRADVVALRGDVEALRGDVGALRGDVGALRSGLESVQADQVEMRADLRGLRTEFSALERSLTGLFRIELAQALQVQTRTMVVTMITLFVAGMSLAFAAARLG